MVGLNRRFVSSRDGSSWVTRRKRDAADCWEGRKDRSKIQGDRQTKKHKKDQTHRHKRTHTRTLKSLRAATNNKEKNEKQMEKRKKRSCKGEFKRLGVGGGGEEREQRREGRVRVG